MKFKLTLRDEIRDGRIMHDEYDATQPQLYESEFIDNTLTSFWTNRRRWKSYYAGRRGPVGSHPY